MNIGGYKGCWKRLLLTSAVFAMAPSGAAWAQAVPDADILVTARKVPEPLLKAPLSVTSVSGDTIVAPTTQATADKSPRR